MSHTAHSHLSSSLSGCSLSNAALASTRSNSRPGSNYVRSKCGSLQTRTCGSAGAIDFPISLKDLNRIDPDSEPIISSGKCHPRHDATVSPSTLSGSRRSAKSSSRVRDCSRTPCVSIPLRSSLLKRQIDSSDSDGADQHQHPRANALEVSERPSKRIRTGTASYSHFDPRMSPRSRPVMVVESDTPVSNPSSPLLSKWQSPATSPLGPRTSRYRRRSRQSSQPARTPTKANWNLAVQCVLRAFQHDNVNRDPSLQSPQWCEDLLVSGLKDCFHPNYQCRHMYHPSDPEFDEEWSEDTWSDEEWSDSEDDEFEDDLPTPPDTGAVNDVEMDVTILAPEERTPQLNSGIELDMKSHCWNKWRTPSKSPSLSWRPESDVRSEKALSVSVSA